MTKNTTPKSRKPSSVVAQLAAQLVAAPVAAPKAKAPKAPSLTLVLTPKGEKFNPDPKRSKVKHEGNRNTWQAIRALFVNKQVVSTAEIVAAIPTHKVYVGYALRSGWLAPATQTA